MKVLNTSILMMAAAVVMSATAANAQPSAQANCGGCEAVNELTEKFEKAGPHENTDALIDKSGDAINALTRTAGNRLNSQQIHAAVLLLAQAEKYDDSEIAVDTAIDVIKANLKQFQAEIKKLPPADRKLVSTTIEIVLDEDKNGND